MADERMPYQIINDLSASCARLSDAEVLAQLTAIPPLADEDDPCWNDDGYWHRVVYPYLSLWRVVAERQLRAAVPLILDRACFGDPGEVMRNLCHAVEAIVEPDWSALMAPCVAALASSRPGTRLWAAHKLGRLRDPAATPALDRAAQDRAAQDRAAQDAVPEVREWVALALQRTRA